LDINFSIIIPVYNRPKEVDELLHSLTRQSYAEGFEVVVIEDGSSLLSEEVVEKYDNQLNITYYFKENSGPGLSRNFGMEKANGNYFIILDSDCIIPKNYLEEAYKGLIHNYTDAFGGADASDKSFTLSQKAINYAMTSMLTTGGIRGNKKLKSKFQPRSFNMGISKKAFEKTKGFGDMNYGEDIDLTFRLWEGGFQTQFLEKAFVYHKRRLNWKSFFYQTLNFGAARPILNKLHPGTTKITYWFPSLFIIGLVIAIAAFLVKIKLFLFLYGAYFLSIFIDALLKNKSILIALKSIWAALVMFFGYGLGFLRSTLNLHIFQKSVKDSFPKMFR